MPGFGAFGKMPALGDFFRFGLGSAFVEGWDRWLQGALLAGRATLGPRWTDCYMSAPIWRFSLSPGLAGTEAAMGVVMPSVDRVGRLFPLTLAAPVPGAPPALPHHLAAEAVFAALEAIALDALEDGMTREALADRLRMLPEPPRFRLPAATVAPGIVALRGDGGAASVWAGHAGAVDMRRPSLWSSRIGEDTRMLLADGLPSAERAVALFDADSGLWAGTASTGGL